MRHRQSFSNTANLLPIHLAPGDVHVAVGYVDLSPLLTLNLQQEEGIETSTAGMAAGGQRQGDAVAVAGGGGGGVPAAAAAALFVGYDSSAYAVASSSVLAHMLADSGVEVDSVIQVGRWGGGWVAVVGGCASGRT